MKTAGNACTRVISVTFVMAIALLSMSGVTSGSVDSQQLTSITTGMAAPEDVAVSPEGKVYVIDASTGRVLIYSANSQLLESLPIDQPVAVAVGISGYKYVATNNKFHVKILNAYDKVINYLGNGYDEFKLPLNIAVDGVSGKVYVIDQLDSSIKVYTPAGTFVKRISDANNQPIDLAVWGNELYVLDQPLVTDSNNGKIRGARVAVFDKTSGNYLRTFGTSGVGIGQLAKPKGIAVDRRGILFISDSLHGVVQCFDTNGTYLGAIQNSKPGEVMSTPQGLSVTPGGKLYVASSGSNDPPGLKIFNVNKSLVAGTDLFLAPASIAFGTVVIGDTSASRTIIVSNNGSESLAIGTISLAGQNAGAFKLGTDNCSGRSLEALASCTVDVLPAPSSEGEKLASLLIPSNDQDTPVASVSLSFYGVGTPSIAITSQGLDFGFISLGETAAAQTLTIANAGNSALAITGITVGGLYSSEFRVTDDGCTSKSMSPTGSCTISISFVPKAEGNRTGILTIQSNDPTKQSLVVTLSGKGYGYPDISVAPRNLDFGILAVGTLSSIRTVTITNHGTVGLNVGKIEAQGDNYPDFLILPNTCADRLLPPEATCEVRLTFYPVQNEGYKTAKLFILSNDPGQGEITVTLQGVASITPQVSVPGPLNPKSKGRWLSVYIELPKGFAVDQIDISTVALHRVNGVEIDPPLQISGPVEIGDYNHNRVPDLMVKFNRQELFALLNPGEAIITVSGSLTDGTVFEQSSTITYVNQGD